MLQRAASNAYSWWWASHIRTKQSKWLEQNLQDMEEKAQYMLSIIDEDGDSFAKRAEMYYRKRPELINFVEESYRAYRALADRYDHISRELQNANRTIATVFPEQVELSIDDDEENWPPQTSSKPTKIPAVPKQGIPKFSQFPNRLSKAPSRKRQFKRTDSSAGNTVKSSGLTKNEAIQEIDSLQKEILGLLTEKEFVKSSYESGVAKFWEIENHVTEMQEKICTLQDEFGVGMIIEDDEARKLMAVSALKSCKETLFRSQEGHGRSSREARVEHQRLRETQNKLRNLKGDVYLGHETDSQKFTEESISNVKSLKEEIKEQAELKSTESLTMSELVENIDKLVNKVISLQDMVASHNALVKRLRLENDELQLHLQRLEEEKETPIEDSNTMDSKVRELEEKLLRAQNLNQGIEEQKKNLHVHFTEASCDLDQLSVELMNVKPDEGFKKDDDNVASAELKSKEQEKRNDFIDLDNSVTADEQGRAVKEMFVQANPIDKLDFVSENKQEVKQNDEVLNFVYENNQEIKQNEEAENPNIKIETEKSSQANRSDNFAVVSENNHELKKNDEEDNQKFSNEVVGNKNFKETKEPIVEEDDEPNWREIFFSRLEDREKILLQEYTAILRNYKEVKKQLNEVEKKNRDTIFESTKQIRELKNATALKDKEIHLLKQKLNPQQTSQDLDEDNVESIKAFEDSTEKENENEIKVIPIDELHLVSTIEEKFRIDIDDLLEENLEFWLRFSTSFHEIQKYRNSVQDLQAEIVKLKQNKWKEGSSSSKHPESLKSETRPLYQHLKDIQTELTLWIEQNVFLKEELQDKFSSICNIQEEIARVSNAKEAKLNDYQAAKFQGEVLNMKQENNKVGDELQAGLDHVRRLQEDIEKTLSKLDEDFGFSTSKNHHQHHHHYHHHHLIQMKHSLARTRIPLRAFLFGVKLKKQKPSIFSCMNPALQKQYSDLTSFRLPK